MSSQWKLLLLRNNTKFLLPDELSLSHIIPPAAPCCEPLGILKIHFILGSDFIRGFKGKCGALYTSREKGSFLYSESVFHVLNRNIRKEICRIEILFWPGGFLRLVF